MGLEKVEHGKTGLKKGSDSLNEEKIPNNASYGDIDVVVAEQANKPLQDK